MKPRRHPNCQYLVAAQRIHGQHLGDGAIDTPEAPGSPLKTQLPEIVADAQHEGVVDFFDILSPTR